MKTIKIAITGASGFIGSEVCKQLKDQGMEIMTINMRKEQPYETKDRLKSFKPDWIIHIAGAKRPPYNFNVIATGTLLKICKETGVTHFCYISSTHVYDSDNEYTRSKIDAEKKCKEIYPDCLVLRIANVYSKSRCPFTFGKIMLVSSKYKRNFIKLDDVSKEIIKAVKENKSGIKDIRSNDLISFNELAKRYNLIQIPIFNYMIEKRNDSK